MQIQDAGRRVQGRLGNAPDRSEWAFLLQDKPEPDRAGWTPAGLSPGPGLPHLVYVISSHKNGWKNSHPHLEIMFKDSQT